MLEGIVRRLLVDRFGRFVHGVDDARLSSGLTSGQLLLSNLRLKEAAAEVLGLAPAFDLRHGTISRMRVDLPGITSFASKPVTIRIEDVFLLLVAAPSDADKVDVLNQAKNKARSKKLHEIETAMSNILLELSGMMAGKTVNESGGFLKSLIPITVILANLRIEIVNIHVRCEDDSATQPGYSFAFGITTQRIQLRAVNDSGQDAFISESVAVSKRKVDITNFAFYWDCDIQPESNPLWGVDGSIENEDKTDDDDLTDQMRNSIAVEDSFESFDKIRRECFIVAPASAFCFVQINSNLQDFNTCRCSINCVVPKLQLHLRSKQFRDAKSIISYQVSMQKRIAAADVLLRLQSRRPTISQAKAWWKYALFSILELIRSRSDSSYGEIKSSNWIWATLQCIGNDRREYIELYAKRLRLCDPKPKARRVKTDVKKADEPVEDSDEKMTPDQEATVQLLEDRLPVSLIVLLRSLVHQNRMVEQVIKEKVENKNAPGYFSWWFAGGPEEANADLSEDQKLAIRKEADIISRLESSTAPNDFELIRLDFQTNVICTLYDSHSNHEQRAIASSDVNISLQFTQYPHSTATRLLIKHLRISDLTASESETLTVLSMYPSSEQSDTVLELFMETWAVRSARNLDLNVKLNIETTKIIWSGSFFRQFVHFLHAGYSRNTLMLFDAAFWEWTEMQQSFLMSAFSKQRKHRIEAKVGVVNVIFVADDSKNLAFTFSSLSIFSEPVSRNQDLYHANLSNFQISIRTSEVDDAFVILDPVALETTLRICTKSLERSAIDVSIPSVNISCDLSRIRILVRIIAHFATTLTSTLSRQQVPANDSLSSSHSPVKKLAIFPAVSLIIPSTNTSPKSQSSSSSAGTGICFRCTIGIVTITSVYCLRLASIEFSGTSSNWILHTDGLRLYNSSCYRFGWIAQSQDEYEGEKACIAFERVSNKQTSIVFGMRKIDWQWSPFYMQSLMDFISDACSVFSELYASPPSSPSNRPIQNTSDWRYDLYLENCTCLFNKRHSHLALFNIVDAKIHYFTSPYKIVLNFYKSSIRDMSSASLRATTPTDILYADFVDMEVTSGDPSYHWAGVTVNAAGCKIVYFHRMVQELCDYISNGLAGIIFGFNPDKKDQWPDFSPDLHGTFCAVHIDFPDVVIVMPACGTASSIRRREGLHLVSKNIHISNSAFADVDNFRTAEWKIDIVDLIIRSLVKTPISGNGVARFSTDYRCPRVPWMTIGVNLSSIELCVDDPAATRSGRTALLQNLAESWVEPLQFAGEPEYHWFLDDILTETGSAIRIELTLQSLHLSSSSLLAQISPINLVFDRNSNWSMNISLLCHQLCARVGAVDIAKTLPEGNISLQWCISGDFQKMRTELDISQLLLTIEPTSLGSIRSSLPTFSNYKFSSLAIQTALPSHSPRETIFSDNSKYWASSFVEVAEIELENDNALLIAVPALAIAIADLLRDSKFVHGSSYFVNADTILRSCSHWPSLNPCQLFILLRDSSPESLLSILHSMTVEILNTISVNDAVFDPIRLHELTSNLRPHEFGFLVYIASLSNRHIPISLSFLGDNALWRTLLDYWKRGLWPLCQSLDRSQPLSRKEDSAFTWSSPLCPTQGLVLFGRSEVQIPALLLILLASIKNRIVEEPLSIVSQFQSSLTVLFQSPLLLKSVLGNEKSTSALVPELIALLLHILRSQSDPVIPFQFRYSGILMDKAIIHLPKWSRHILLSIAHLINFLKINDAERETICNVFCSAMLWTEPISFTSMPSALSNFMLSLIRCLDVGNHQLIDSISDGIGPRPTLSQARRELVFHLQPIHVCLVAYEQPAIRLSSSLTTNVSSQDGSQTISVAFNSLELFGFRSWESDWDSGKYQLLNFKDNPADVNEFRIAFDSTVTPSNADLDIKIGNVSTYLCAEDYGRISSLCSSFLNAIPSSSSSSCSTTSGFEKLSARLELKSFAISLCRNDNPVGKNVARDALFTISFGLHPLLLAWCSHGGMENCSFSASLQSDFLHPKVAVWEPVLEPFTLQFSLTRTGMQNYPFNSQSPALLEHSSASNLITNLMESNIENTIQVFLNEPVRFNVSADTISSLFSLGVPSRTAATSTSVSACAFTLKNFSGVVLRWHCNNMNGVLEDMASSSLECLGSNPWEPAHPLSLTVGDQWLAIPNAYVGNVGAFQFALIPIPPGKDHRLPQDGLVLEALIENGHAVLSAHSSVGYFNCTSLHLRIVFFNGDAQHELDLDPSQTRWAPLLYCAWDAFCIGVVEDGDSVRQLGRLSLSALRRKRRSEHVFCVGGNRYVFLCASSGGLWPGRLAITVRAPLDIRNHLPYPIDVKFDDGSMVRIDDGFKRQIETIDGSTDVQLRFSMQGFEWSNSIAVFAEKSQMDDGRRTTMTITIQDRFGAALYVVVEIARIIAVDDYESKLNGRALFRITLYTRLWLLNQVPGVELLFGSSKGVILPGQNGRQIIDYVYENQRWYPGKGWSAKLLPGDRPSWSDIEGRPATLSSEQLPGPDWTWVDSGWTVDTDPVETDDNGWAYSKNFSKTFHAEHKKKYLVRRRRYSRARMLMNDSAALPICMFSPGGRKQLTSRYSTSHICVKTCKSDWSSPINLLHGTDTRVLTMFTHDFGRILDLGIHISPARHPFRDTWIASFVPRYIVWNSFSENSSNVCVQQLSDSFNICVVRPGKQRAFFFNRIPFETEKSIRATYVRVGAVCNGSMYWSSGFDINCVGLHVLRVSNSNVNDNHRILQLQISLHKASVILYIGESDPSRPRYSIRNELSTPVTISQLNSPMNVNGKKFPAYGSIGLLNIGKIEPNMVYSKFAWDLLSVKDRFLCVKIQDSRYNVEIDTIGVISALSDSAFVSVYADGDTNVVLITPSETRAKRVVQAYNDHSSDSQPDCWLKIVVHIEEAVFSLISNSRTELMLIELLSTEATLTRSSCLQNIEITLDALRIDNQLCLEQNSSFAFPNVIKSECSPSHSFIWFQCIRSFHTSHMKYYKLFDLAVQPFVVNLEETYIVTVLEFVRSVQKAFQLDAGKQSYDAINLDPVSPSFGITQLMYFEVLRTPTIKMQLSVRKAQESLSHEYLRERIGLAHLLGVLLTNLEAKPIRRPGHEYVRLCDRTNSLREQLLADYKGSLLLEFLASFGYNKLALGGVVPILSTFRAGVRDFRKEIQSSLKQGNIRGGLTRGTFSLVDHTARGLMMPITGLSAGFGDVISALTFDKDFTSRRALDVGNKPHHIVDGLLRGGRSFGLGVFNGIAALVREPIKHYRRHPGGVGIAVGIGKGVAQAVASPIVGVFDAINHLGTGIARTPDYFRRRSSLIHSSVHFRLPRAFYGPGRSIRIYNGIDALIVDALYSAKPPIDATIHHVFIGGLMNDVRAYAVLIRGIAAFQIFHDRHAPKLLWFIAWSSIKSFELIEHGIKIFSVTGIDSKGPSWLLVWLSQPGPAFDMIMATHSRYKSALRVQSRRNLHIPLEDANPVEIERNLSEST